MVDGTERFRADAMIDDRRAKTLSSYAGDTALPGGRIDDDDKTIEDTAVRPDTTSPR
jgi:8-oxo-dGTP pyrophosphatase MutT (NUDIX family)